MADHNNQKPAGEGQCLHPPESVNKETGFCSLCCTYPAGEEQDIGPDHIPYCPPAAQGQTVDEKGQ